MRANYLASPPLVVAYALAGTMDIDLARIHRPDSDGKDVFLKDIWPITKKIADLVEQTVTREAFQTNMLTSSQATKMAGRQTPTAETYDWPPASTYVQNPPYFQGMSQEPGKISNIEDRQGAGDPGRYGHNRPHLPGGSFKETPLRAISDDHQVPPREFNSYGSRRGNHEVMMRGTFANIRIKNEMLDGVEGGYTLGPDGAQTSIYDAAMAWQDQGVPLVVFAGEQYGAGSSRDWAAKGTALLGVKAVVAETFERIHRSNLVGMGVIPFEFTNGVSRKSLGLKGDETVSISGSRVTCNPEQWCPASSPALTVAPRRSN